ncbi:hypothetical protein D3C76_1646880 [compost metagenome]
MPGVVLAVEFLLLHLQALVLVLQAARFLVALALVGLPAQDVLLPLRRIDQVRQRLVGDGFARIQPAVSPGTGGGADQQQAGEQRRQGTHGIAPWGLDSSVHPPRPCGVSG